MLKQIEHRKCVIMWAHCFIAVLCVIGWANGIKNSAFLLKEHKSYSLSVTLTNQNGLKSGNDSQQFTIQAPKYHRVMFVIQELYLWPEIEKEYQSYLQFIDSDGTSTEKIYGNVDKTERNVSVPEYLTGRRTFYSAEENAGLIFINHQPDHVISSKNERRIYAKVAITAFRDTCTYRSIPPPSRNSSKDILYRSCITSTATGVNCIVADLFCDETINCADFSESGAYANDEAYMNCDKTPSTSTTPVLEEERQWTRTVFHPPPKTQGGDVLLKTLIVDQEYNEYFTEMFKTVVIGFLGLCTTCILIAFVVTMFCVNPRESQNRT